MPVSDVGWTLTHQLPVFAVYGTKRKVDWKTEPDQRINYEAPAKRLCPSLGDSGDGMNDLLNHDTIHDNNGGKNTINGVQENHHQHFTPETTNSMSMESTPHQQDNWNNNAFCQQQQELYQQPCPISVPSQNSATSSTDMVMDLCDETTSGTQPSTETDSVHSTMESDFVPDYQQYKLVFCDSNCVGGDRSPTSGKVRCYCKPSWEGLTDPRMYISDYY